LRSLSLSSFLRLCLRRLRVLPSFPTRRSSDLFDGTVWSVVPSPSPGALQNILFGVGAITDSDVWAVGGEQDANGLWHTLTEHWDGPAWSVVSAVDAGSSGNQLYAVKALATDDVYAVGQQAGAGVPNQA